MEQKRKSLDFLTLLSLSSRKIREIARRDRLKLKEQLTLGNIFGNYYVVQIKPCPKYFPKKLWTGFLSLIIEVEKDV